MEWRIEVIALVALYDVADAFEIAVERRCGSESVKVKIHKGTARESWGTDRQKSLALHMISALDRRILRLLRPSLCIAAILCI